MARNKFAILLLVVVVLVLRFFSVRQSPTIRPAAATSGGGPAGVSAKEGSATVRCDRLKRIQGLMYVHVPGVDSVVDSYTTAEEYKRCGMDEPNTTTIATLRHPVHRVLALYHSTMKKYAWVKKLDFPAFVAELKHKDSSTFDDARFFQPQANFFTNRTAEDLAVTHVLCFETFADDWSEIPALKGFPLPDPPPRRGSMENLTDDVLRTIMEIYELDFRWWRRLCFPRALRKESGLPSEVVELEMHRLQHLRPRPQVFLYFIQLHDEHEEVSKLKHAPSFYFGSLNHSCGDLVKKGIPFGLIGDAKLVASKVENCALSSRLIDAKPTDYERMVRALQPNCTTKYGATLRQGEIGALVRIWLNKVAMLCSHGLEGTSAIVDAGLFTRNKIRWNFSINASQWAHLNTSRLIMPCYKSLLRAPFRRDDYCTPVVTNAQYMIMNTAHCTDLLDKYEAAMNWILHHTSTCPCWDEEIVLSRMALLFDGSLHLNGDECRSWSLPQLRSDIRFAN